ncbi:MAG TPA: adenosylcobinamide-GDP ribazoletransferase [Candidatus Limnocylindrales bacterium]|nr:adenosylcobinamide-GDP ribazoletransferase [Candidatus Limnocylindrales bacterium]
MSPEKAIKTFRDLLSFLTIIPAGGKEDFIFTTAEHVYLFPIIGCFIGVLAGAYFLGASVIVHSLAGLVNPFFGLPVNVISKLVVAAMTVAFLLVLTGLQHFDGLIDLGNAFGLRDMHDRKMVAHAWTVTHWGALLALIVELAAFAGLFLITPLFAFGAIVAAELSAKLAMVTVVWIGKPAHKGLGSIFLQKAKTKLNLIAYALSVLIVYFFFAFAGKPYLGFAGVGLVLVSIPVALVMEKVSEKVFGGVSGDAIGATNEVARAVTLVLTAGVLMLI